MTPDYARRLKIEFANKYLKKAPYNEYVNGYDTVRNGKTVTLEVKVKKELPEAIPPLPKTYKEMEIRVVVVR